MEARNDTMGELHNGPENGHIFVPEEGQGGSLCSNKEPFPCPSLGVNNSSIPEDTSLDYLAGVLVDAFLDKKRNEIKSKQK
jgi:hypothetical protein